MDMLNGSQVMNHNSTRTNCSKLSLMSCLLLGMNALHKLGTPVVLWHGLKSFDTFANKRILLFASKSEMINSNVLRNDQFLKTLNQILLIKKTTKKHKILDTDPCPVNNVQKPCLIQDLTRPSLIDVKGHRVSTCERTLPWGECTWSKHIRFLCKFRVMEPHSSSHCFSVMSSMLGAPTPFNE
jgi:hypothetical protein